MNIPDDEEKTTTTLSHETRLKIAELKRLVYRHRIFSNPDVVIKCVTHFAINGDNTLLDEKLEQLRTLDSAMGYTRM
jgi:acetyl-CoA carboxylase beta subunit